MKQHSRLPRKIKKKLGPSWKAHLKEQNTILERDYHIDNIFNKDYENGHDIIRDAVING